MSDPNLQRWQRIETTLHAALEQPAEARASFLAKACAGDAALLAEVSSLLAAHAATGTLALDRPAQVIGATQNVPAPELAPGSLAGPFRIECLIGRGGMGEVYRARRADGAFEQRVAIKLIRPEAVKHLERFHTERQILARLEHPGIARLLDGGTLADGRPYMAMEYVEGSTLTRHCRERPLDLDARLALFRQVCEAVAYAHAHLVVHRDLKGGNVMVTAAGEVKLLDFGIAKLVDAEGCDATLTQLAPLTPETAAPEQLSGAPVSTATDVYALGVILHDLLTGLPLWDFTNTPVWRALDRVLHQAATRPSEVAAAAAQPPVPARLLRGDLDAIVGQCLRKAPRERYASAGELLAELDRHRLGLPLSARGESAAYVLGRFLRRHRLAVGSASAVLLALLAGLVTSLVLYKGARTARDEARAAQALAQRETARARAVSDFLNKDLLAGGDFTQGSIRDLSLSQLLARAVGKVHERFADQPETEAEARWSLGESYYYLGDQPAALAQYAVARRLFEASLGADDERTIEVLDAEALLTESRDARCLLRRDALARATRRHPATGITVLGMRRNLAWDCADDEEARLTEMKALLPSVEGLQPPDEKELSNLRWMLGYLLMNHADYAEAEELMRLNLAYREKTYGTEHMNLATPLINLVYLQTDQGRYAEAERDLSRLRVMEEASLPPEHIWHTYRHWAEGRLRLEQGRLDEAEAALQLALSRVLAFVRPDDPDWDPMQFSQALALVDLRRGQPERARKRMQDMLPRVLRFSEPEDAGRLSYLIQFADLLRESGRALEARAMLASVSTGGMRRLPPHHPLRGELRRVEGLLKLADGDREGGRGALEDALGIYRLRLAAGNWRVERVERELARLAGKPS